MGLIITPLTLWLAAWSCSGVGWSWLIQKQCHEVCQHNQFCYAASVQPTLELDPLFLWGWWYSIPAGPIWFSTIWQFRETSSLGMSSPGADLVSKPTSQVETSDTWRFCMPCNRSEPTFRKALMLSRVESVWGWLRDLHRKTGRICLDSLHCKEIVCISKKFDRCQHQRVFFPAKPCLMKWSEPWYCLCFTCLRWTKHQNAPRKPRLSELQVGQRQSIAIILAMFRHLEKGDQTATGNLSLFEVCFFFIGQTIIWG